MKLFLSWSGKQSNEIAAAFRDWMPMILQHVQPYMSSSDINKGARWATDIATELQASNFGLIFVTSGNHNAPWIMFEAGALAKAVDKALVAPLLFGVSQSELRDSPLLQFQATDYSKHEIKKLLNDINESSSEQAIAESTLDALFETLWPKLDEAVQTALARHKEKAPKKAAADDTHVGMEALEEAVVNTRNILKWLSSREQILLAQSSSYLPIQRLERPAIDASVGRAEEIVKGLKALETEMAIELGDDGVVRVLRDELNSLIAKCSDHAVSMARLRKRLLQMPD